MKRDDANDSLDLMLEHFVDKLVLIETMTRKFYGCHLVGIFINSIGAWLEVTTSGRKVLISIDKIVSFYEDTDTTEAKS